MHSYGFRIETYEPPHLGLIRLIRFAKMTNEKREMKKK